MLTLISLVLAGCGGEEYQDLRNFVKNSGAGMRGKIEPPPEVRPYEHFAYVNDAKFAGSIQTSVSQKSALAVGQICLIWIVPKRLWKNFR